MENHETPEKQLANASLKPATDLIQGVNTSLTITAQRTRMKRVASDLMEAAGE